MISIKRLPYLQMPQKDGITVMWETDIASGSEVEVYLSKRLHTDCVRDKMIGRFLGDEGITHKVKITALAASTNYYYRVISRIGDQVVESDYYQFKTSCNKEVPFSFCITSETGGYGGFNETNYNYQIFDQIRMLRPDFLFFVGDMVSDGLDRSSWDTYLFDPGSKLMTNTPFYMCQGNHEENTFLIAELFDFPPPHNYFAFDYGDAVFIVLDSTTMFRYEEKDGMWDTVPTDDFSNEGEQIKFLISQLEQTKARWKFVFFHYPPYVSGFYEVPLLRKLSSIFEKYNVNLVFNSHTIVYERSHPIRDGKISINDGVTYIVAGGAGAMPEWFLHKQEWHTARSIAVPHFLQVIVSQERIEVLAINSSGQIGRAHV